ncbi:MAG: hypothetical protein Q7R86_02630 [bacterium]|nr:hypothetical protein [bacterium]
MSQTEWFFVSSVVVATLITTACFLVDEFRDFVFLVFITGCLVVGIAVANIALILLWGPWWIVNRATRDKEGACKEKG